MKKQWRGLMQSSGKRCCTSRIWVLRLLRSPGGEFAAGHRRPVVKAMFKLTCRTPSGFTSLRNLSIAAG